MSLGIQGYQRPISQTVQFVVGYLMVTIFIQKCNTPFECVLNWKLCLFLFYVFSISSNIKPHSQKPIKAILPNAKVQHWTYLFLIVDELRIPTSLNYLAFHKQMQTNFSCQSKIGYLATGSKMEDELIILLILLIKKLQNMLYLLHYSSFISSRYICCSCFQVSLKK